MAYYCACSILVLSFLVVLGHQTTKVEINVKDPSQALGHFWKSTGLCPPDPKEAIYKFLLNNEEKFNLALIGALPNQGIQQVRVHWLFNLIFSKKNNNSFNFDYLDEFMLFLVDHNLKPTFELMGMPMAENGTYSIKSATAGQDYWANLVRQIVGRYIEKFGAKEVAGWKFETWNEPDLKNYNVINFTLPEYFDYINGCAEGLKNAFRAESSEELEASLGGPAGLFRDSGHPLCWGLLEYCNSLKEKSQCPIQFISFHRKGDGTAEGVLNGTLQLLDLLQNKFPNLTGFPIANDESDIITTWSNSYEWLGDARYAAMVVKVIADHYKSVTLDRKLKIEVLSNDNGFLNYHPFYFTQRTLFARFQMNHTDPPHNQFIKKPVYSVMGLLSLLGEEQIGMIDTSDPLLTVLATKTTTGNQSIFSVVTTYTDDDNTDDTPRNVDIVVENLPSGSRYAVYLVDNILTNPYQLWIDLGKHVFPQKNVRQQLRSIEEPYRLQTPIELTTSTLNITLNLTIPSVSLVHVCSKPIDVPGPVSQLAVFNVTGDEVLLTWSDKNVNTKCIRTYEVEFESKCANSLEFARVNMDDTIFLSYHHAATGDGACEATIGRYRVRAVDYWDQPGEYSEIISYPSNAT